MKRIDIDFIRRRRRPVIEVAVLLAALVLLGDRIHEWQALEAERQQSVARIAELEKRLQQRQRTLQEKEPDSGIARRQAQNSKVHAALTYPWPQLLAIVETPDMAGVALLSFTHDSEAHQVRLTMEALDVQTVGKYVKQLNQASSGSGQWQWYVSNYQLQSQNSPVTVKATILTR
jgi:hypothetical protein